MTINCLSPRLERNKDEIVDIITNQFGIKSPEDFKKYYDKKIEEGVTLEEIELLSPDNIDNNAFWSYLDKEFPRSICNIVSKEPLTQAQINHWNGRLALQCGVMNEIFNHSLLSPQSCSILEIGAGHGAISFIVQSLLLSYYCAIDVVPRFGNVIKSDGYTIPEKAEDDYDFIVSCNVFQHLSMKQRHSYYKEVHRCLKVGGKFSLAIHTCEFKDRPKVCYCEEDNRSYICHYGQFTPLQDRLEIMNDLRDVGKLYWLSDCLRSDGFGAFHFIKLETDPEPPQDNPSGDNNAT